MFSKFAKYHPLLRTRGAELKGYQFLPESLKKQIVPIFELTRSRTSKNNPIGSIEKQFDRLEEVMPASQPFVLDLTTEETLSNSQISDFLYSTEQGFFKWVSFLKKLKAERFQNVIPTIIYNDGAELEDYTGQIQELDRSFDAIAFRIDVYDDLTDDYLLPILENISSTEKLMLIFDASFIPVPSWEDSLEPTRNRIDGLIDRIDGCRLVSMSSSFPKTVVAAGYGKDASGDFPLVEIDFTEQLNEDYPDLGIVHGDYAGIHPIRYQAGGGGWIPRIDVPKNRTCFYHRYRREEAGYVAAASMVVNDPKYEKLPIDNAWADNEIQLAAIGNPSGKSPAHWISIRANMHIIRQAKRLGAN